LRTQPAKNFFFHTLQNVCALQSIQKTKKMEFFNLPIQIISEILSKFIFPNELAVFDIAVSERDSREKLLNDIFQDQSFFFWTDTVSSSNKYRVCWIVEFWQRAHNFERFASWLFKRQVSVRKFRFLGFNKLSSTCIEVFWMRLNKRVLSGMQHFNFEKYPKIHDDDLKCLSELCPNTRVLNISSCNKITDSGIRSIAHLKYLEILNVSNCLMEAKALQYVTEHCPNLKYLWWDLITTTMTRVDVVLGTSSSEDDCLPTLNNPIGPLAHNCKDLQLLSFQCGYFDPTYFSISLNSITKIAKCFPRLTRLLLNGCVDFCDEGAVILGLHCPTLRFLGLGKRSGTISDVGIMSIANGCTQLEELNVNGHIGIRDVSVIALSHTCRKLSWLDIRSTSVTVQILDYFVGREISIINHNLSFEAQQNGSEEIFDVDFKQRF